MINTLYLPELREYLAAEDEVELREFCHAIHPARVAEFMEGLTADETWTVLRYAELVHRAEIFSYLDTDRQIQIMGGQDRGEIAAMVAELAADDRADILQMLDQDVREGILQRLPASERRNFLRLSQYPGGTAGAVMTTEFASFNSELTIEKAIGEIGRLSQQFETIYYLYVLDEQERLVGLVSARQLLAGMRRPDTKLAEIMETELTACDVLEDQEEVAEKVAQLNLLAIPVVDSQRRMLGIITHDDVMDVVHEEAIEDAHRIAAVDPLDDSYMKTSLWTLSWKRGVWLVVLFFFALLTAFALDQHDEKLSKWVWLVPFIPLVISSGGNTGSQSATLIITALSRGHVGLKDWQRIIAREFLMGLLLGSALASIGYLTTIFFEHVDAVSAEALVVPITLLFVVVAGTLTGSVLPLAFARIGLDPALMSNPFVAGIIDIVGILIYMNVAVFFLSQP
jgi:magnesium transporter